MASFQQSNSQNHPLFFKELEMRVWKAVDELEEAINEFNKTPGKRDGVRRADLASALMSLLAQQFGVAPHEWENHDTE